MLPKDLAISNFNKVNEITVTRSTIEPIEHAFNTI